MVLAPDVTGLVERGDERSPRLRELKSDYVLDEDPVGRLS